MKVSLNWIRSYNDMYHWSDDPAPSGIDDLVEKVGAQLGAVEEVIDLGKKYKGALVAKVVECTKHPNADKLSICLVDDGGVTKGVKRNSKGLVQVVCGAANVKAGQIVAWLPPGVTVPSTYDKDPFVLEAREIRGELSNGMIASARELGIGDDHTGILVLDDNLKLGQNFAEAYKLDDYIIDIENKMFTHRPDLFGMMGIAREIAGIAHKPFKSPAWYSENADLNNDGRKNVLKVEIKNELPKLVPRFTAVAIKDVKVQDSPVWLRAILASLGVRPINNIVDLTNYYMLLTAQPLHAYDYDKVKTGLLGVREARDGEELTLLGGKNIKLSKGTIIITDGKRPIGLGGVMGGADTEVDELTRNIILEVANFDMNRTRSTAMEYGLFTDAATRFTKNQSPRQTRPVLLKAVDDIKRIAGGRVASRVLDNKHVKNLNTQVKTDPDFINQRLGLDLSAAEMKKLLTNVEFRVDLSGKDLQVTAPFWRTDIEIAEDLVEEIGRLHGYDNLPLQLPKRSVRPARYDELLSLKAEIREALTAAGANELLTYSFVRESLLAQAGQDPKQAYHIRNALSPDLQYYRLSLTPSLLEKVHSNIKLGYDEFAIFEMNKSHNKQQMDEVEKQLPKETETLALVLAGRDKTHKDLGASYYQARTYLDFLASRLGIELSYRPLLVAPETQFAKPFEATRSAHVFIAGNERILGIIGEFKPSVARDLKLPKFSAGFEISLRYLAQAAHSSSSYHPLNRYPSLGQDLCLRASVTLSYHELIDFMTKFLDKLAKEPGYFYEISPLDVFQKPNDKLHKQTTWHIELGHPERTLTTEEANKLFDKIAERAKIELNAERI